jgi:hypothetical protein
VGIGVATALACLACCIVELGLFGGLSALTVGVELSELARFAPLLILPAAGTAVVVVLRQRRRRARRAAAVPLGMPQLRQDVKSSP